jgi:hypothetical protein
VLRNLWTAILGVVLFATGPAPVSAETLPTPTGEVILTVRGNIGATNVDADARLDLAMLQAIGMRTLRTSTIWTDGEMEFQGVDLARLMSALGASGSTLRLTALNDYAVDLPLSEAVENGPMLAYQMNGKLLSPRDKGPLWMVYPYDLDQTYRSDLHFARSVWQLTMIEVLP